MAVQFISSEFEKAHGRAPKGRGSWAFSDERTPSPDKVHFSPSMTLVEAKKWFRAKLKDMGVTDCEIYILP